MFFESSYVYSMLTKHITCNTRREFANFTSNYHLRFYLIWTYSSLWSLQLLFVLDHVILYVAWGFGSLHCNSDVYMELYFGNQVKENNGISTVGVSIVLLEVYFAFDLVWCKLEPYVIRYNYLVLKIPWHNWSLLILDTCC